MGFKKINGFWLMQNLSVGASGQTFTSTAQNVQNFDNICIEVNWTVGEIAGQLNVLASVSEGIHSPTQPQPVSVFSYLDFSGDPNTAGYNPGGDKDEGSFMFNLTDFPFPYIQFQYVDNGSGGSPVSHAGNINVYIYSKDVN